MVRIRIVAAGLCAAFAAGSLASPSGTQAEMDRLIKEIGERHLAGDYDGALSSAQKALDVAESIPGPDHLAVAKALIRLSYYHQRRGDMATSLSLMERAAAASEKISSGNERDWAHVLKDVGGYFEQQGDYARAERDYRRALELAEGIFGPENVMTNTFFRSPLESLYRKVSGPDEAAKLAIPAERIRVIGKAPALSFGCVDRRAYDLIASKLARGDTTYAHKLTALMRFAQCINLNAGMTVYVSEAGPQSGAVQVRPPGNILWYWTSPAAIGPAAQ